MTGHNLALPLLLSVSDVTRLIRDSLEEQFQDVWIEGEISNLRAPSSGHLYFTLKDNQSQLRGVLFRSGALRLRFALQEGLAVIARGRISVYEPRGEYQLIVDSLDPKGVGAFQLAFEQLKERLSQEGLFDEARKRRLPSFPRTVGVVTSLTGAAIRDIVAVLRRRCPIVNILIAPVPVQGDGAGASIAEAICALSDMPQVEVLIVGRGGGASEDLWAFNEEAVVRAIARSRVPVVSAVGHEIDVTLSDFAADHRAPTPSAAAEAVVPVLADIIDRLDELAQRLRRIVETMLQMQRHRFERSVSVLGETRYRIQAQAQRLDELQDGLTRALTEQLTVLQRELVERRHLLLAQGPRNRIQQSLVVIPQLCKRLEQEARRGLISRRQAVVMQMAALDALSPLGILQRGFSIVQTVSNGRVLRRASDVAVGESVQVRLAEGQLVCQVDKVMPSSIA
ncbi:MAG TPA: exodeoxyribonuclease VII large subunit [Nitrospira sp.]|nr:exodeoxyribonuclease VII large subunit [Nitrospira sp.]HQV11178.1 exodeoxyribonuclease VII large subunit [Nitrospira sp.]